MESPNAALPSPVPQAKPQKVQTIGILMLISAALNISMGAGFVIGMALSVVLICCAPIGALPLALGIFELVYGIRLVGSGREPVSRQTLQTVAILEVMSILVSNIGSAIAGIANLVLLNEREVIEYIPN
ncbi:MAG: hypothetical protein JW929_11495 [Anaerolineales bacterium]|nr:hypothetical protein [Anaerolineales bacterium]